MALTLRKGKKTYNNDCIAVSAADIVVHISDRRVEGIVFVVPCCYRNRCLVATQDDGRKHSTMGIVIASSNLILQIINR